MCQNTTNILAFAAFPLQVFTKLFLKLGTALAGVSIQWCFENEAYSSLAISSNLAPWDFEEVGCTVSVLRFHCDVTAISVVFIVFNREESPNVWHWPRPQRSDYWKRIANEDFTDAPWIQHIRMSRCSFNGLCDVLQPLAAAGVLPPGSCSCSEVSVCLQTSKSCCWVQSNRGKIWCQKNHSTHLRWCVNAK